MSNVNFKRGLVIDAQGICFSNYKSYDLCDLQRNDTICFHAKLVNSTTKKKSFLLKNRIEISNDDLEHVSQIFDIDEAINSETVYLVDESPTNDVFLIIRCTKVELIIKKETIYPSTELTDKVKEALNHYDPYHELINVFNKYGYFLSKKIILGHKIYRTAYLTVDKNSKEPNCENVEVKWTTFDDFSESKFGDILSQWEKYLSPYKLDLSYLVSTNGGLIMKNRLNEWFKICLKSDPDSLQVISCRELYPLYEILESSLRQEVESVLGINRRIEPILGINDQVKYTLGFNNQIIKEKVLMAGVIQIDVKEPPYSYCVDFPNCFKSNNYQVFGKFITRDDEPIDEVVVKFDFMDIYGFLVFIEKFELIYEDYEDPKIAWILIGIPAEVGYFSKDTRKINILGSGNEPFRLKSSDDVIIEVPENLLQDSVIINTFKFPPSNYKPNLIAKIQCYKDNISFNICCLNCESSISKENNEDLNSLEYSIRWFVLQNSDENDSSEIMFYLSKIGQKFLSKTKQSKYKYIFKIFTLYVASKFEVGILDI